MSIRAKGSHITGNIDISPGAVPAATTKTANSHTDRSAGPIERHGQITCDIRAAITAAATNTLGKNTNGIPACSGISITGDHKAIDRCSCIIGLAAITTETAKTDRHRSAAALQGKISGS